MLYSAFLSMFFRSLLEKEGNKFVPIVRMIIFVEKDELSMTLNEAFSKLITQQAWYKNSGYLKEQAIRDKRYFLAGKMIPEVRIREYLGLPAGSRLKKNNGRKRWKIRI